MSDLPNDLWRKIFCLGIKNSTLTFKDICSISLTCKHLYRLSSHDSIWSQLHSSDFYGPISLVESAKMNYKFRFQSQRHNEKLITTLRKLLREIEREILVNLSMLRERAGQISVLEPEWRFSSSFRQRSEIEAERKAKVQKENLFGIISVKIREIELTQENKKRKSTVAEYFNLPKANSNGFECVPNRCYPREKRTKGFTKQRKTWYR